MEKIKLIETFDTNSSITLVDKINESNSPSRVDGKYIIGMIEGQFFKPDGMSRNGRWYPRSLWERVLNTADVKNRLASSTMFGEIGHSDGPVEDLTLRQGCASHFIDKLWIDKDGRGMGRAYILNTPTGQLLKTYLGAGCKLKVSTRGEGLYKEGCTHDGCPVIDDETYDLQTADFVINPGFIETSAILREEYTKVKNGGSATENKQIQETIAYVKKEGEKRMEFNMDAYIAELKDKVAKLEAKNESLNEQLKAKENELLQKQFNENAEITKLTEELQPFRNFKVSADTLNEAFKKAQTSLKKEKAEKAKISEELEAYKEQCGTLEDISLATKLSAKSLQIIEEYRKYGTPEDFKEAKDCLVKATKMIKDLNEVKKNAEKALPVLKESKKLEANASKAIKMIESLKKELAKAKVTENVAVERKNDKIKNEALELSKNYKVTVESAAKLIKKHGSEKATELIQEAIAKKGTKTADSDVILSGKKLVEDASKSDKAVNIPAEKTAKDFLKDGMIRNYFNQEALGKEVTYPSINTIDGTKADKHAAAKELLKKFKGEFEAEKAPEITKKELTPAEAEAEVKKLLK